MPTAFSREDTLELIRRVEDIPTLPDVFFRIKNVIEDQGSNAKDMARVIGSDQATATMLLKVANSAHFNREGKPIGLLEHAVARIGFKETANIAMAMSLLYGFCLRRGMPAIRLFWAHAYGVAVLSKKIAAVLRLDAEEIFVAGLLHDIGRAILGIRVDMFYFEGEMGGLYGDQLIEREMECFGLDHAGAGAEIMALWHFPPSLIQAVKEHHEPDSGFLPARIISLANREAHKYLPDVTDVAQVCSILAKKFPTGVSELLESGGLA